MIPLAGVGSWGAVQQPFPLVLKHEFDCTLTAQR